MELSKQEMELSKQEMELTKQEMELFPHSGPSCKLGPRWVCFIFSRKQDYISRFQLDS